MTEGCRFRETPGAIRHAVAVAVPTTDGGHTVVWHGTVAAPSPLTARLVVQDGRLFLPAPPRSWLPIVPVPARRTDEPGLTIGQRMWRDRRERRRRAERYRAHWAAKRAPWEIGAEGPGSAP